MAENNAAPAGRNERKDDRKVKDDDIRNGNILSAKAVADAVRTSLGPKGMDKMISTPGGEVVITNDGATILKQMEVNHPAAKMLVDISKAQDTEAGDGTTSVVVMAGGLLQSTHNLLAKGIHPYQISEGYAKAAKKSGEILQSMATPVDFSDRESLIKAATTSLSSKVVAQNSALLAPLAVDAVLHIADPNVDNNVDLRDIRVVKKLGGTVDDTELIEGIVFTQKASKSAGGPTVVHNAKVAVVQFCISAPKPDLENTVVVTDYQEMDRILKEESLYVADICRKIARTGCNVVLLQKSILRDAITDLGLHYLAKLKIMVVRDLERDEIEFVCKTLQATPIASVDSLRPEKLGRADLVEEVQTSDGKIVKITGVPKPSRTVTILCRGSNKLVLDENERSIHDALCVVRSLFKKRFMISGGGAPEIEISTKLGQWAKSLAGMEAHCVRAFAEALEIIPSTLAENAGLNPINIVTELRNRHANGEVNAGINVRKGTITNILEENVVQPLLVTLSAINLATDCVRMILKIDDIIHTNRD